MVRGYASPLSPLPSRSCYFQQFAWEIRQYLGTAARQVYIILDADAAPAGFVDAGLDGHDCARSEWCFDGFGEARGLVDFKTKTMAQTVAESFAIAAILDIATRQTIRFLTFHAGAN